MLSFASQIEQLTSAEKMAAIRVQTLGTFQVWREEELISTKEWGRDKTIQLFQFFVTARHRHALHKEKIIDRIWEDVEGKSADQTFKVALHGVNKALEPNRKSRTEARFIKRQGITYQLNQKEVWIDVNALEDYIKIGNLAHLDEPKIAIQAYQKALTLYEGMYLPNRLYEDWSSEERERIQVLTLGALITLGELIVEENPMESIRLSQQALLIDHSWEDAYRLQMQAYLQKGNRPMAIKTYQQCQKVLDEEFGIAPLPETKQLFRQIQQR